MCCGFVLLKGVFFMQEQCENITLDDIMLTFDGYLHVVMEGERSLHLKDNDGFRYYYDKKTQRIYAENGRGGWNFLDVVEKPQTASRKGSNLLERAKLRLKKVKWAFDN